MNDSAGKSVHDIAERFVRARMTAVPLSDYPGPVPDDLATAYACQAVAMRRWPDVPVGWKVARIGPQWQDRYPQDRIIGPVFRRHVWIDAPGQIATCPVFDGGFAAVEAEIGICVGCNAPATKTDWTSAASAELVGEMRIGVEIASSPLATLNDLGPGAVVSDFGNNWGVIVGAVIPDWRTRSQSLQVETFIDDDRVGHSAIAIPETPLDAFAFALNQAARLGRPLRSGEYISTGMITGVHDIAIGKQARFKFGDHPEIRCRIVAAGAFAAVQEAAS